MQNSFHKSYCIGDAITDGKGNYMGNIMQIKDITLVLTTGREINVSNKNKTWFSQSYLEDFEELQQKCSEIKKNNKQPNFQWTLRVANEKYLKYDGTSIVTLQVSAPTEIEARCFAEVACFENGNDNSSRWEQRDSQLWPNILEGNDGISFRVQFWRHSEFTTCCKESEEPFKGPIGVISTSIIV